MPPGELINQMDENGMKTSRWEEYYKDGKLMNSGNYFAGLRRVIARSSIATEIHEPPGNL